MTSEMKKEEKEEKRVQEVNEITQNDSFSSLYQFDLFFSNQLLIDQAGRVLKRVTAAFCCDSAVHQINKKCYNNTK